MTHHGSVFKQFRQNRGFTQKAAAKGIVSPQFLAKFENGESDITFTNLNKLLQRIFVSWREYIRKCDCSQIDQLDLFDATINQLLFQKNFYSMKKMKQKYELLYQSEHINVYQHFSILIDVVLSLAEISPSLSENRLLILKNHLLTIENWGDYENFLFGSLIYFFSVDEVKLYCPRLLKKMAKNSTRIEDAANCPLSMKLNIISFYIRNKEYYEAKQWIDTATKELIPNDPDNLFEKIMLQYKSGIIAIYLGDDSGIKHCEQCIQIFDLIDDYEVIVNSMYAELQSVITEKERG